MDDMEFEIGVYSEWIRGDFIKGREANGGRSLNPETTVRAMELNNHGT